MHHEQFEHTRGGQNDCPLWGRGEGEGQNIAHWGGGGWEGSDPTLSMGVHHEHMRGGQNYCPRATTGDKEVQLITTSREEEEERPKFLISFYLTFSKVKSILRKG